MAYKLKWYLDMRRADNQGRGRLNVVIYNNGSTAMMGTGVMLNRDNFVSNKVVGLPMANQLNQMLRLKMAKVQLAIEELGLRCDVTGMRASEIKREVMMMMTGQGGGDAPAGDGSTMDGGTAGDGGVLWDGFAERFVKRIEKERTAEVYEMTRRKVAQFCDVKGLCFEDMTVAWLRDFETWMAATCGVNTRGIHFRNIRAIFNAAIDEEVIPGDLYPFRRFKIKKEETMKRSLSVGDLRRLMEYRCEGWQRKYVDVFVLSFYLAGINMVDLMALPPLDGSGVIEYRRSKTGVVCRLTVPPEAREIIERYKGVRHLLSFGDVCEGKGLHAWKDWLHRLNDGLQRVGPASYMYVRGKKRGEKVRVKVYDALFPDLTSYWARHTWATLASEIDVPDAVIDAALGHKSPFPMADVYIKRNGRKVDDAVRRVIEYVKGNKIIS